MTTEDARIAQLIELYPQQRADLLVGIGDDAAVLKPGVVLSVDACVEGVHFRRTFARWRILARRAAMAALSDLAAMGATPKAILSSIIVPSDVDDQALISIHEGFAQAADEVGTAVVGGNLSAGKELSFTTTVVGHASHPLCRHGAQPGDGVFITGSTGDAALGLEMLLRHQDKNHFAQIWCNPRAHIKEGQILRDHHASACIDLSDGLLRDLGHLCIASGVGAFLELSKIPYAEDFLSVASELGLDPDELLLRGGEAYVLIFTAQDTPPIGVRIGRIEDQPGIRVCDRDGNVRLHEPRGFQHWR